MKTQTHKNYPFFKYGLLVVIIFFNSSCIFGQNVDSITVPDTSIYEKKEQRDSLSFREVPDSVIKKLQKDKAFAYANDPRYWIKEKVDQPERSWISRLTDYALVRFLALLLLVGILIFALSKIIVSNKLFIFKKRDRLMPEETNETLLKNDDLSLLIKKAEEEKDYRMAIRYWYIYTLQKLDGQGFIHFHPEKTNAEYLLEMKSNSLSGMFEHLTLAYEYVWYGEALINEAQYRLLRLKFESI